MSPELKLLLEEMHADIREQSGRLRLIENQLAEHTGSVKLKERLHTIGRWSLQILISVGAVIAGHFLPLPSHR